MAGGGFEEDNYCSSSEYDKWTAWTQFFGDGLQYTTALKDYSFRVRAVRVGGISLGYLEDE